MTEIYFNSGIRTSKPDRNISFERVLTSTAAKNWHGRQIFQNINLSKKTFLLKGVFAKNVRGYRLTAKNYRW